MGEPVGKADLSDHFVSKRPIDLLPSATNLCVRVTELKLQALEYQ